METVDCSHLLLGTLVRSYLAGNPWIRQVHAEHFLLAFTPFTAAHSRGRLREVSHFKLAPLEQMSQGSRGARHTDMDHRLGGLR